jgi:hypothetical protein
VEIGIVSYGNLEYSRAEKSQTHMSVPNADCIFEYSDLLDRTIHFRDYGYFAQHFLSFTSLYKYMEYHIVVR